MTKICKCKTCKQVNPQPLENFHKSTWNKDKLGSWCKICTYEYNKSYLKENAEKVNKRTKKWNETNPEKYKKSLKKTWLKLKYNMTVEELEIKKEQQQNKCAICYQLCDNFHIDHCHTTQKVRGLLCGACNKGLGLFKDNQSYLANAIDYLNSSGNVDP